MQSIKQAIFMLGQDEFSLDIMDVIAIEKEISIEPVSSFTQNFKGVISLRGDIIPVYSLRRKFGMEEIEPDADTRFVITFVNEMQVAFEVDKMAEILQVNPEQINDVPVILKDHDTSYMKLISKVGDHLVIMLDKNGILSEEEHKKMVAGVNKIKE